MKGLEHEIEQLEDQLDQKTKELRAGSAAMRSCWSSPESKTGKPRKAAHKS